jgi:para-aminobenzoate synthetase component 1
VYLAYGLSQVIRRDREPSPPEPCRLPLLAAVVRRDNYGYLDDNGPIEMGAGSAAGRGGEGLDGDELEIGPWSRTWDEGAYATAVDRVRAAIGRGDVYQVNLVQHLSAPFAGSPRAVATRLATLTQPRSWPLGDPRWRLFEGGSEHPSNGVSRRLAPGDAGGGRWAIVSASPELFLARRGDRLWTMPIKGTRPAGWAAELHASAKDAAEHVMIVDLERNDLSRVCVAGSVRWPQLMATEPLAGVEHMVSLVEGTMRADVGLAELLQATFPGGSVTGAPKIAAVDLIAGLEPVGRGTSLGALGRIHGNGDLELALTIRTFAIVDGRIHLWVGGGIVWDSDPIGEVAESFTKARPLLDAIRAPLDAGRRPVSDRGHADARDR